MMGRVYALSISEKRGTRKTPVDEVMIIEDWGIKGDAHSGNWHRQVTLLAWESMKKIWEYGLKVGPGDFAENITTEGVDLTKVKIGDRILIGEEIILQVTQIGKECHKFCEIQKLTGKCIMPKEGIFTRCLNGGIIKKGDPILIKKKGGRMNDKRAKILVVDDDIDFIEATKITLESRSYEVSSALNGKEALEKIPQEQPDLVILDVMMGKVDEGFDVCRKIKADPKYKHIPILMLTAIQRKTGFDFKAEAGDEVWLPADDYVDKPVAPSELLARVGNLLRRSSRK